MKNILVSAIILVSITCSPSILSRIQTSSNPAYSGSFLKDDTLFICKPVVKEAVFRNGVTEKSIFYNKDKTHKSMEKKETSDALLRELSFSARTKNVMISKVPLKISNIINAKCNSEELDQNSTLPANVISECQNIGIHYLLVISDIHSDRDYSTKIVAYSKYPDINDQQEEKIAYRCSLYDIQSNNVKLHFTSEVKSSSGHALEKVSEEILAILYYEHEQGN